MHIDIDTRKIGNGFGYRVTICLESADALFALLRTIKKDHAASGITIRDRDPEVRDLLEREGKEFLPLLLTPLESSEGGGVRKSQRDQMWRKYYEILLVNHPGVPIPNRMSPEEATSLNVLLGEYKPEIVVEIFKVAIMDWDAFTSKIRSRFRRGGLPAVPDIRTIEWYRKELAAAVARKGITTDKHPCSKYGRDNGAYDSWKD